MNLIPIKNKVIVLKVSGTKQTASGIILKRSDEPDTAKVIAIGPDVEVIAVGDSCLVDWNKSEKVDEFRFILPEDAFIGVFENE